MVDTALHRACQALGLKFKRAVNADTFAGIRDKEDGHHESRQYQQGRRYRDRAAPIVLRSGGPHHDSGHHDKDADAGADPPDAPGQAELARLNPPRQPQAGHAGNGADQAAERPAQEDERRNLLLAGERIGKAYQPAHQRRPGNGLQRRPDGDGERHTQRLRERVDFEAGGKMEKERSEQDPRPGGHAKNKESRQASAGGRIERRRISRRNRQQQSQPAREVIGPPQAQNSQPHPPPLL